MTGRAERWTVRESPRRTQCSMDLLLYKLGDARVHPKPFATLQHDAEEGRHGSPGFAAEPLALLTNPSSECLKVDRVGLSIRCVWRPRGAGGIDKADSDPPAAAAPSRAAGLRRGPGVILRQAVDPIGFYALEPRLSAWDEIVDSSGRDAVQVGLHHDRGGGTVNLASPFEGLGEERIRPELADLQFDGASFGREPPVARRVAPRGAGIAPLVRWAPILASASVSMSACRRNSTPLRTTSMPPPVRTASSRSVRSDRSRVSGFLLRRVRVVHTEDHPVTCLKWWSARLLHHSSGSQLVD